MYLTIAQMQYLNKDYAGYYNIGPNDEDCVETAKLVGLFCKYFNESNDEKIQWINKSDGGPHEANFLKLDCSKMKKIFNRVKKAINKTNKTTFIVYLLLRILVILCLIRELFNGNYENSLLCILRV